jgi:5'-deoxynucleotidase YfbR-like HD superfamily hydrolase
MKTQLSFIMDGGNTRRYHTVPTLLPETVAHHSQGVALIAHLLMSNRDYNPQVIWAALLHDMAEYRVGDVPSPSKREFGIAQQLDELESRILRGEGFPLPALSSGDQRILKLADIAQGALFCAQEMSMGNGRMRVVFDRYMSYAEGMILVDRERELFDAIKEIAQ